MNKHKIQLVEDEMSLALIVKETLESQGFNVVHSRDGTDALQHYFEHSPDLIVLDVMLPKKNGYSVAKKIRSGDRQTPIIFLTAKSQTKDVIEGFESGGNDYMRKPFSIEELIIRIKVMLNDQRLLSNTSSKNSDSFEVGDYHFNSKKQVLTIQSKEKSLTSRESELLKLFCLNQNQILPKETILLKIWGDDSFFNSRSMDVFISKLRKHLSQDPTIKIINIRGLGYKLIIE